MLFDEERTDTYIESLDNGNGIFLDDLEAYCLNNGIPVIRKQVQGFLKTFLKIKKPEKILEVGTAAGFSAILMAANTCNCHITTIEKFEKRILLAKDNFSKSGYSGKISLIEGDAGIIIKELVMENKDYDFIFMDAAKAQYITFLPDIKKLLNDGGVIITDNVLQDNTVIQSKYAIDRRDRTIHKRMREYLYALTHDESLTTSILPVADGIAVSVFSV